MCLAVQYVTGGDLGHQDHPLHLRWLWDGSWMAPLTKALENTPLLNCAADQRPWNGFVIHCCHHLLYRIIILKPFGMAGEMLKQYVFLIQLKLTLLIPTDSWTINPNAYLIFFVSRSCFLFLFRFLQESLLVRTAYNKHEFWCYIKKPYHINRTINRSLFHYSIAIKSTARFLVY